MRAAVLHGKEDVRVEEVPSPELARGEVRLRIEAALTCGTDLKVFKRGYHARMIVPPSVFGHELAGVILETGSGADASPNSWRAGDRVVVANSAPCGDCFYCRNDQENLCDDLLFLNGAYAEEIVVPERLARKNMLRLPDEMEFVSAALVEPLACVVQGADECNLRSGQSVLVLGTGPIGLMFIALARHLGCDVTAVGRGERRLRLASQLGAARVLDIEGRADWRKEVPAALPQRPDTVIEAVGRPEAWEAAVEWVRKGGTVNFFGGCPSGTSVVLDTGLIHYSNLMLLASFHHRPRTVRKALELITAGVVRAEDFVDGACGLSELPELLRVMAAGNRAVKTLVRVRE